MGRTCVAVGAKLWLVKPLGFRTDEKTLRRAGLDYWEHLEWEVAGQLGRGSATPPAPDHPLVLSTKNAEQSYLDVTYKLGDVLVFGSETAGLPPSMLKQTNRNLSNPHPTASAKLEPFQFRRHRRLRKQLATRNYGAGRANRKNIRKADSPTQ